MFPVHYFLVIGLSQTDVEVCGMCFQSTIFWLYVSHRLMSRFVGCVFSPLFSGYRSLTDWSRFVGYVSSPLFSGYTSLTDWSRFVGCVSSPLFSGYRSLTDSCRGFWGLFPVHYFLVIRVSFETYM